jgi:hypothetical protein
MESATNRDWTGVGLDAARKHLHKPYESGDAKQIKLMALDNDDLKPL